jgi:hypothetical protein
MRGAEELLDWLPLVEYVGTGFSAVWYYSYYETL